MTQDTMVSIRVPSPVKQLWERQAKQNGMTLSMWLRLKLLSPEVVDALTKRAA